MTLTRGNGRSDSLSLSAALFLGMLFFSFLFVLAPQTNGQKIAKKPQNGIPRPAERTFEMPRHVSPTPGMGNRIPDVTGPEPYEPTWMEFTLQWTNFQAHRTNDVSPLEIFLDGAISTNTPEIWTLTTVQPRPGHPPNLYFVGDVLGRSGGSYGSNVALSWELSLNGGPFEPMAVLPDNSICFIFPAGNNTFRVRIGGLLPQYAADGYYQLYLQQSIIPQL